MAASPIDALFASIRRLDAADGRSALMVEAVRAAATAAAVAPAAQCAMLEEHVGDSCEAVGNAEHKHSGGEYGKRGLLELGPIP
eukprot:5176081-Alexandrium_andersonii.AAC.1